MLFFSHFFKKKKGRIQIGVLLWRASILTMDGEDGEKMKKRKKEKRASAAPVLPLRCLPTLSLSYSSFSPHRRFRLSPPAAGSLGPSPLVPSPTHVSCGGFFFKSVPLSGTQTKPASAAAAAARMQQPNYRACSSSSSPTTPTPPGSAATRRSKIRPVILRRDKRALPETAS